MIKNNISKKNVLIVLIVTLLVGCSLQQTSHVNQGSEKAAEYENALTGNNFDKAQQNGPARLIVGLKEGQQSLADAAAEIEAVINAVVSKNSGSAITQDYVTLTRVHDTGSLTEQAASTMTNTPLSEDQLIQTAYDNLTSEVEKALFRDFQFKIDSQYASEIMAALESNSLVDFVQEDYLNVMYDEPNDPYYQNGKLWGLPKTYCNKAWDLTKGDKNVIVAVVDGGVDGSHPDLVNNLWKNSRGTWGYDFSDDDWTPEPEGSHGTHVAGTIGAVGNNGIGVVGVAPNITIMSCKIFPNAYSSVCAKAIRFAVDNGARVLNNSWGPSGRQSSNPTIEKAIDYAYSKGAVVVFAAGNSNDDAGYYYGGNHPDVICVAAVDQSFRRASFSNYGNVVDIAAPGVSISSTVPNGRYSGMSGTSMAAPHIAGLAALMISRNPSLTNARVLQIMKEKAIRISATNIGAGVMNAYDSLIPGIVTIEPPTNLQATTTSSSVTLTWSPSTSSGVVGYKVYQGGSYVRTVSGTSVTINGLSANTAYTFSVSAVTSAGKESRHVTITATTKGSGGDTRPPSTPTNLTKGTVTSSSVSLSWSPSSDNVGVTGYKVYKNGAYNKTVSSTSATISGLSADTTYTFAVSAVDAAGNESSKAQITVKTGGGGGGNTWKAYTFYNVGDVVTYNQASYRCIQAHTAYPGWEPSVVPALWKKL